MGGSAAVYTPAASFRSQDHPDAGRRRACAVCQAELCELRAAAGCGAAQSARVTAGNGRPGNLETTADASEVARGRPPHMMGAALDFLPGVKRVIGGREGSCVIAECTAPSRPLEPSVAQRGFYSPTMQRIRLSSN